jgi:hypothetical protein
LRANLGLKVNGRSQASWRAPGEVFSQNQMDRQSIDAYQPKKMIALPLSFFGANFP